MSEAEKKSVQGTGQLPLLSSPHAPHLPPHSLPSPPSLPPPPPPPHVSAPPPLVPHPPPQVSHPPPPPSHLSPHPPPPPPLLTLPRRSPQASPHHSPQHSPQHASRSIPPHPSPRASPRAPARGSVPKSLVVDDEPLQRPLPSPGRIPGPSPRAAPIPPEDSELAIIGPGQREQKVVPVEPEGELVVDDEEDEKLPESEDVVPTVPPSRSFSVGGGLDDATAMSWKNSLIKRSLLRRNRHFDAEAIQCFKNIMSYMGDRKSSKGPIEHSKKFLKNLIAAPAGLRDEAYLQLCKQTTKNPKPESTVRGWELFAFCVATFPPSKQLQSYLTDYCRHASTQKIASDPPTEQRVKNLIRWCADHIESIINMGQRKHVPSTAELESLKTLQPVIVRIHVVDDTFSTLVVDSFTTNQTVQEQVCRKYEIRLTSLFGLYETVEDEKNVERILLGTERILDAMGGWDNPTQEEEAKERKASSSSRRASGSEGSGGGGGGGGIMSGGLSPRKSVRHRKIGYSKFLFKAKLALKTTAPSPLTTDPAAFNLTYLQTCQDVVTERYPLGKKEQLSHLAALQLQASFGDLKKDLRFSEWLRPKLEQYIPHRLLCFDDGSERKFSERLAKEWEQLILNDYTKLAGFSADDAKASYLEYVQSWPLYGTTFFLVEQRQLKDYPQAILLGVHCEGLVLLHPEKRTVLETYDYPSIQTWGHSDEKLVLVVGTIVQQRRLIFKTQAGQEINHLIFDYVKIKKQQQS